MADGTLVKEIERLTLDAVGTLDVAGVKYAVRGMFPVLPPEVPAPDPLVVHTLTGLVEYVKANHDELALDELVLHVVDPMRVDLVSPTVGYHRQRFTFASAQGFPRSAFAYGQFHDLERFNIALQSQFEPTDDRAGVLLIVGNVEDKEVRVQRDDGVGQGVTVKSGIGLEMAVVPNPVRLAPFRTFPEVMQPPSQFVLRLRKGQTGIEAALFEGDGGAWRVEAIGNVRDWLRVHLPDLAIIA